MAKELYVGKLSENTTEDDLRNLFSVMGTVTSVHLIIDPETKEFKRCGYVRMTSDVDPQEVAETLDGALLDNQIITVSIARPQKPGMSKSGGRGRFGGPKTGSYRPKTSSGGIRREEGGAMPERKAGERRPGGSAKPSPVPGKSAASRMRGDQKPGRGPSAGGRPRQGGGRNK